MIGVAAAVAQGGLFFATKSLKPKWSRLNPLQGAKRLFGPHALWEGAKMLLKSAVVGLFVWRAAIQACCRWSAGWCRSRSRCGSPPTPPPG